MQKTSHAPFGFSSSGRLAPLVAFVGLQALGCSAPIEGDSFDETIPSSIATEHEALMGDTHISGCNSTDFTRLTNLQKEGRILSRSNAYLECLAYGAHDGVPRFTDGSGNIGPYTPCSDDPIRTAPIEQQIARLTSMSASRLITDHICDYTPGWTCGGQTGFAACAGPISQGQNQRLRWKNTNSSSGLIWHEVGHNHGYGHPSGCGVPATEPLRDCMVEVRDQSAQSPECASLSCASNEKPVISRYGQYGSGDSCECVPDVFGWPNNQNVEGDRFGQRLATGDFNNDGYDDLAVHSPKGGGAVYVFRGSYTGLRFWKRLTQLSVQAIDYGVSPPLRFDPGGTAGDNFGGALAAGDLNDDGYDELIVGTPDRGGGAGEVYILGGTPMGLDAQNAQWLSQTHIANLPESGDRFGAALAVGRFDSDSFVDLAIGIPFENQYGVVATLRGRDGVIGTSAFVVSDNVTIHQGMGSWANETGDEFGLTLAAGDLDDDGLDELLIGAPGEDGGASGRGAVYRAEKTSGTWNVTAAISPPSALATRFGGALAIGDILGGTTNGAEDFAVGAPSTSGLNGSVFVYRSGSGVTPTFTIELQGSQGSQFGRSLAIGNVTGSSKPDLIVGAPAFSNANIREGRLSVFPGAASNSFGSTPTITRDQSLYAAGTTDTVVPPEPRSTDQFASALAIGSFDGDGLGVAVGAPTDRIDGISSGAVFTFSPSWQAGRRLDQVTTRHGDAWPPY